jgi:hypothetical protein
VTDRAWVPRIGPEHIRPGLLNVVVYGPGEGEGILLVLPDGSLGVVDGCEEENDPVAELIRQLPATSPIRFVCLTHPHDDHYAGLGRLIDEHFGRVERICFVSLVNTPRVLKEIERAKKKKEQEKKKVKGFKCLRQVIKRALRDDRPEIIRLSNRRPVYQAGNLEVRGCAPSDADITAAEESLSADAGFDPNKSSAVLAVRFGGSGALLTGDLETSGRFRHRGWLAAATHIDSPIQLIKAAHHASELAHCLQFWAGRQPEVVLVTPFKNARPPTNGRGGGMPPKPTDLVRLAAHTPNLVVTSPPLWLTDAQRTTADLPSLLVPARPDPTIPVAPTTAHQHRHNAVLVALDDQGVIQAITLAGQARFYGADGLPQPLPTTPPVALGVTPAQGTPAQGNPAQGNPAQSNP